MTEKASAALQTISTEDGPLEDRSRPMDWPTESGFDAFRACLTPDAVSQARRSSGVLALADIIEREVIPRLVLAHRTAPAYVDRAPAALPTEEEVTTLTALSVRGNAVDIAAYVEGILGRDVPLERVYLDLLAPVARRLGAMWEADACDFATVTMGLCALQQIVLDTGRRAREHFHRPRADRRAVLAPVPGEQHGFGLLLVAEFFRRSGWEVWSGTGAGEGEIAAKVRGENFAIAGFTLSSEDRVGALAQLILVVRRVSMNRRIGILVGGTIFQGRPGLVADVGADATAADGAEAALQAETLIAMRGLRA